MPRARGSGLQGLAKTPTKERNAPSADTLGKGKLMVKKLVLIILAAVLCVQLSGCSLSMMDPQNLLSPPKSNAAQQEIYNLLQRSSKDLRFVYPRSGEERSAIVMRDFTGDGTEDAVAFYMLETGSVAVQFITQSVETGEWITLAEFRNAATQVDRICFGDVTGNGTQDVIIGWGNATNLVNASMNVYVYSDGNVREVPIASSYGEMILTDFNEDEKLEIFLTLRLIPAADESSEDTPAKSVIFEYIGDEMVATHSVQSDNSVTKFSAISFGNVSEDKKAVFIDAAKADSSLTTQIFFFEDDKLVNFPAGVNDETTPNLTFRPAGANFYSRDINDDGIIEVPIVTQLPAIPSANPSAAGATVDSTSFLVFWYRYNGTDRLISVMPTLMNLEENYWFEIPRQMADKITTVNDQSLKAVTYVEVSEAEEGETPAVFGSMLFVIRVFSKSTWANQGEPRGFVKIGEQGNDIYAILDYGVSKYSYLIDKVKNNFTIENG